jgi:hypothetical protein
LLDRDFAAEVRQADPALAQTVLVQRAGIFGESEALDPAKREQIAAAAAADPGNQTLQQQVTTITNIEHTTKQATLGKIAVLPMLMLFCYLGLMAYFRSRGGYRAERLVTDDAVPESPPRPAAART